MARLPADRTKLNAAIVNQQPSIVASAQANREALIEAYDTIDMLYNFTAGLVAGGTLQPYPHGLYRNAIINGNFDVWQRGTSFTKPNFAYTADRWKVTQIVDDKVLVFRSPEVPNKQSLYSLRVETTESNSGAGAATDISQPIEHYQLFRGKTVTFSGYVYCDQGASFVPNIDDGIANTPGETYTAAAWTKFSVTKPIGESATMLIPYGRFLRSGLSPGKGIYLAQLQLTVSDTALPFQPRSFAEELALCQRYFEKSYDIDTAPGMAVGEGMESLICDLAVGVGGTLDLFRHGPLKFKVPKRITPTVRVYNRSNGELNSVFNDSTGQHVNFANNVRFTGGQAQVNLKLENLTGLNVINAGDMVSYHWTADAEL